MYRSTKQEAWFHSAAAAKKGITPEMIAEWDKASEGKTLPEDAPATPDPKVDAKQRLVKFLKRTKKK